jgi:uncharacterized OB-fold protein
MRFLSLHDSLGRGGIVYGVCESCGTKSVAVAANLMVCPACDMVEAS